MSKVDSNSRRERSALVLFILLVVVGGIMAVAYFSTGKQWTHTATIVDDATGNLQDYTVVVFEGIEDLSKRMLPEVIEPAETMEDAFGTGVGKASEDAIKERILSVYRRAEKLNMRIGKVVHTSDVRDLYEMKGANVCTLNLSRPESYIEPVVLETGGKRIGIFSVLEYTSKANLKSVLKKLRKEKADEVICICESASKLASFDGMDAVILLREENREIDTGKSDAKVILPPNEGTVGVVLFSSNNVVSTKTVKQL